VSQVSLVSLAGWLAQRYRLGSLGRPVDKHSCWLKFSPSTSSRSPRFQVSFARIMENQETISPPRFLRPAELQKPLRRSLSAIYTALAQGHIPHVKVAGSILIPASFLTDLEEKARANATQIR
jgi:hypothetical protein